MKVAQSVNSSKYVSVPSPVGGLNVLDNYVSMPANDAIALENLVPQPYGCTLRGGYIRYSTGYPLYVTSLATWSSTLGTHKLFAWSGTNFYDATVPGAVPAPLVTGLGSPWWQSVNFANSAGTHMLAFNGVDDPIWYSGAGVQRLTAAAGPGQWTGVNPATIVQATVHQRRVWGVQVNTARGWYLAADAVLGAATMFDFGPIFKRGGYLVALTTWTIDDGDGSDDHLVAISSNGEAAVYAGIDPASASTWALVGVYFIGAPVSGRRFFNHVSGDLLILTQSGLISMGAQVTSSKLNSTVEKVTSRKIQYLLAGFTSTLGDLNGWQVIFIPALNLLVINIPSVYASGSGQLVYNIVNGAWCTFSGIDAAVWVVADSLPYFGGSTVVNRAWHGNVDDVLPDGSGGTSILGYVRQAYSYLQAPALQKQIGMYRPNFISEDDIGYMAQIDYDFVNPAAPYPSGTPPIGGSAIWDSGIWDLSLWSGGFITTREWSQAQGIGVSASITMRVSASVETTWVSTDYTYKIGGAL